MYDIPKDLLDAFRATPAVYEALLAGVTEEQARTARGGDENWSVVEIVCHLRDAAQRALERMQAMRDANEPFLPGYDQDAWARERNYARANLRDALAEFLQIRAQQIAELEALPPDAWERTGMHEEQGRITVTAHTLHLVSHDLVHAAQIARQLGQVTIL
jgi:hypothetical protein